jgi:hypothetical protein
MFVGRSFALGQNLSPHSSVIYSIKRKLNQPVERARLNNSPLFWRQSFASFFSRY